MSADGCDDVEIRAQELDLAGLRKKALRVGRCGLFVDGRRRPCHDRLCPRCADEFHRRNHEDAIHRARAHMLTNGYAAVLHARAASTRRMSDAMDVLLETIDSLKEHVAFAFVHGGVSALEVAWRENGAPDVHAHLWLDVREEHVDHEHVDRVVRSLSAEVVTFSRDDEFEGAVRSPGGLARYLAKTRDRCPPVRARDPVQLRALAEALHHRRLIRPWGTATGRPTLSQYERDHDARRGIAFFDLLDLTRRDDRAVVRP